MPKKVTYYVRLDSLTIIPRNSEASARKFCEKMDWDYLGVDGRYAWSSAMSTYIRGSWAVAYMPDGQQTLIDKDDVYEHDK